MAASAAMTEYVARVPLPITSFPRRREPRQAAADAREDRHSTRPGHAPARTPSCRDVAWVPACAGMTRQVSIHSPCCAVIPGLGPGIQRAGSSQYPTARAERWIPAMNAGMTVEFAARAPLPPPSFPRHAGAMLRMDGGNLDKLPRCGRDDRHSTLPSHAPTKQTPCCDVSWVPASAGMTVRGTLPLAGKPFGGMT